MAMLNKLVLVMLICFSATVVADEDGIGVLKSHYLDDSNTSDEIKSAIKSGVVVKDMCPLQAFASAGFPGPYMVKRDVNKWEEHTPPPKIISAQCKYPDDSTIELMFRNTTQFQSKEPVVFRVRFIKGKAVLIDQKGFTDD